MSTYSQTGTVQIAKSQLLSHFFKPTLQHSQLSRHAKAYKFNLALSQDENPYQTGHLYEDKSLAVLISN